MPDPLTLLGAAGVAAQFIEQGLTIVQFLYSTITTMVDAPEVVRIRLEQIDQLNAISKLIIQHPSYQAASIEAVLRATLSDIKMLQDMLLKTSIPSDSRALKRWTKSFLAVMKEASVETAFTNLERQKTNLIVCMQAVNSDLLCSAGIQVQVVQTAIGEVSLIVKDTARNLQIIQGVLPGLQEQVTTIYQKIPEMTDRITSFTNLLPDIGAALEANRIQMSPGYFNIPNRRTRQFVGREDVITKIHEQLFTSPGASQIRCVVLRSLGGQGKSQTSLEYCRRFRDHPYTSIFWVDASSEKSILKSFNIFYERSKNSGNSHLTTIEAIVEHVCDVFKWDHRPWLMVFDNLDDHQTLLKIRQYMPDSLTGSILITTRRAEAKELATCAIELGPLAEDEAVKLLLQANTESGEPNLDAVAKDIVLRLSCHALAITQAGSYIRQKRLKLSNFMDQYTRFAKDILSKVTPMTEYQRSLDTSERMTALSVFTTWQLSLDQLKAGEGATNHKEDLLNLLACCKYTHDVPEALFKSLCEGNQPLIPIKSISGAPGSYLIDQLGKWDQQVYSDILEELYDLALIDHYQLGEDGLYTCGIHPLVAEWVQLRLEKSELQMYQFAVTLMQILHEEIRGESARENGSLIKSLTSRRLNR